MEKLLKELFDKKILRISSYDKSSYEVHAIEEQGRNVIEQIIRKHFLDNRDEKLGVLEAKVFMYEQIISKSNFAPMLESKSDQEKKNEMMDLFSLCIWIKKQFETDGMENMGPRENTIYEECSKFVK